MLIKPELKVTRQGCQSTIVLCLWASNDIHVKSNNRVNESFVYIKTFSLLNPLPTNQLKRYIYSIINIFCVLFFRVREGPELNKDSKPASASVAATLNEANFVWIHPLSQATFVCFVKPHS